MRKLCCHPFSSASYAAHRIKLAALDQGGVRPACGGDGGCVSRGTRTTPMQASGACIPLAPRDRICRSTHRTCRAALCAMGRSPSQLMGVEQYRVVTRHGQ